MIQKAKITLLGIDDELKNDSDSEIFEKDESENCINEAVVLTE